MKFSDAAFAQEGWGAKFTVEPGARDVHPDPVAGQDETYDFWIDDMYFIQ